MVGSGLNLVSTFDVVESLTEGPYGWPFTSRIIIQGVFESQL